MFKHFQVNYPYDIICTDIYIRICTTTNYNIGIIYLKMFIIIIYIYIYISYMGFMQVIRADMTCLGFIFPELKAREIYNPDRSYQPV